MLIAIGILLALAGILLFGMSLVRTVRANPDSRIPWIGEPSILPNRAILQRALGAGLAGGGAVMLGSTTVGWVGVCVMAVLVVGACAVVIRHNAHVRAAG